jgi:hypothetical protein
MTRIRPSCRKPAQSAAEQRRCTESHYPVALFGRMWWAN